MGLRLADAVRLASGNVVSYKLRSLAIILTVSVIFGLVMGVNFLFAGMRESMLEASVINTDGYSYVSAYFDKGSSEGNSETRLAKRIERDHGEVVGVVRNCFIDREQFGVIDLGLVEDLVDNNLLSEVPEGRVPVIVSRRVFEEEYSHQQELELLEAEYYQVGEYASEATRMPLLPGEYNILNLPLTKMYDSPSGIGLGLAGITLVDDGSGRVEQYIEAKRQQAAEGYGNNQVVTAKVIRFGNFGDLTRFVDTSDTPERKALDPDSLLISAVYSDTADIARGFIAADRIVMIAEIILLVVAVIVTAFTFIHLIDQDARTVALYRSLGASTREIIMVYFIYLLELFLLAVVASVLIGLGVVAVVSLGNAGILAENLQMYYDLSSAPKVTLLGIDWRFFFTIGLMLVAVIIALFLSADRFSKRRIAMALKKD